MKNLCLYKSLITTFTLALVISINTTEIAAQSLLIVTQNKQNSTQLIDKAKQLYHNQKYLEASRVWQQAVEGFKQLMLLSLFYNP